MPRCPPQARGQRCLLSPGRNVSLRDPEPGHRTPGQRGPLGSPGQQSTAPASGLFPDGTPHQGPSGRRRRGPGTPGEQARRPALTSPRPGLSSRARGRQSRGGTGYSHSGREGRQKEETLGEGRWSGVEGRGSLQAEGHICDEKQDFILGQWTLPPGLAPVPSRTLLPFL